MRLSSALLVCAVLAGSAPAQRSVYFPSNTPSAGTCNVIPFGTVKTSSTWRNQKYQTILLASKLGSRPGQICELAFAPCTRNTDRHMDAITIKMNHTKLSTFAGNSNFASNLGANPTTVLSAKDYVWHLTPDKWNRIGLQKPFLYIPARGNVIVEITVFNIGNSGTSYGGFHRDSTEERLYAIGWSGNPPANGQSSVSKAALKLEAVFDGADLALFGQSCGSIKHTLSGSAKPGQAVVFGLTGAPKIPPISVLMFGSSNAAPYPVKFPGTSCYLYQNYNLALLPVPIVNGAANVKVVMPKLSCAKFYSQYLTFPLGKIETTNYGRVLIGN